MITPRSRGSPATGTRQSTTVRTGAAASGRLREGARSYAKDGDGNYLATCQAQEAVENGLRLDPAGNFNIDHCPKDTDVN